MKSRKPDDLLKEILADEALDALRADSLVAGLAALQARRRRRVVQTAALTGMALLVLSAILLRPMPKMLPNPVVVASVEATPAARIKIYPAPAVHEPTAIPAISDDDLLALFKNQSVALLGEAGRQKLVVFNEPATRTQ